MEIIRGGGRRAHVVCTAPIEEALCRDSEPCLDGWEGCRADHWTALSLNVISLRSHSPAIYELGGDLLFLTEVRVTEDQSGDMEAAAQRVGYSLKLGHPVPRGPDRGRPHFGGVALAAQGHMKIESIAPHAYGEMTACYERAQFCAAWVAPPDESQCILACSIYGKSGQMEETEVMLTHLSTWLAREGGHHWIIGGDLNVEIEDSPALQTMLHRGQGYHAVRAFGGERQATCMQGAWHSEIDHILVSPSMMQSLTQASVLMASVIPTHRPVSASFKMGDAQARCCIPLPSELPSECVTQFPMEGHEGRLWQEHLADFRRSLSNGALDDAWQYWNVRWESLLLMRAQQTGAAIHTW